MHRSQKALDYPAAFRAFDQVPSPTCPRPLAGGNSSYYFQSCGYCTQASPTRVERGFSVVATAAKSEQPDLALGYLSPGSARPMLITPHLAQAATDIADRFG